jgi:hypothetical protein
VAALACTDIITDTKTMAMAILIGLGFPAVLFFTLVEPAGAAMIPTLKIMPALYGSNISPQAWDTVLARHHALHVTTNEVDPVVYMLLMVCALALVTMLMIQRGRATPERSAPNAAELNTELQTMSTFRRQMSAYLNRELTATELEDERRRLAVQQYIQEHGYSPLSPSPTPPASPTSVVSDPPEDSEYSPVSADDDASDSGDEGPAPTREQYTLALATVAQTEEIIDSMNADSDEEILEYSPVSDVHWSEYLPPVSPVSVAPEPEEAREHSPVPGNDDAMEDGEEVAIVTPRGARYNRRSGALTLATLMCCIGEAQSTATTAMHANTVNPSIHVTMSIQLTGTWALAMCSMVVMVALTVAWKLNLNGKLVHKTTGRPYNATPQFNSSQFENPSGTRHFFPGNGSVMTRLENHDCDTTNCKRQQMTKNGVALQNQLVDKSPRRQSQDRP